MIVTECHHNENLVDSDSLRRYFHGCLIINVFCSASVQLCPTILLSLCAVITAKGKTMGSGPQQASPAGPPSFSAAGSQDGHLCDGLLPKPLNYHPTAPLSWLPADKARGLIQLACYLIRRKVE